MKPKSAMIFAAGFGTRLGDLVKEVPKPLIQVGGKALIDHALEIADEAGIHQCVVNLHYHADKLACHLANRTDLVLIKEHPEILDTGGGLLNAINVLGTEAIFTLNSDTVWHGKNPLHQLIDHWPRKDIDALLLLVSPDSVEGHSGRYDFILDSNGILQRAETLEGYVYTGTQIIKPDCVKQIGKKIFSLNEVWDRLIPAQRIAGVVYSGKIGDAGTVQGLKASEELLRLG